jgi:putative heme transporter
MPAEVTAKGEKRTFGMSRRFWAVVRYVVGLAALVIVLWVLSSHRSELSGLSAVLSHIRWWWIPPAVVVELASYVCFARMQGSILMGGGLRTPSGPLLNMTFASQAIANSLPAGTAVSSVYGFRWYRRFGADDALAAWSLAGTFIAAVVTLSLVAAAGLALAASQGASLDLVPVIVGVLVLTMAIGALFVYERPLAATASWAVRACRRVIGRPRGDLEEQIELVLKWLTTARLGWRDVVEILFWGTSNWLLDCSCFAMMFLAVGTSIPWKGLLLAYGAGQLAATLPITPGGLGVVEGSITIALVAFGSSQTTTVDAVLMYRLISFWLILLIGWSLWGVLGIQVRRGRWSRNVRDAEVEAGVTVLAEDELSGPHVAPMPSVNL